MPTAGPIRSADRRRSAPMQGSTDAAPPSSTTQTPPGALSPAPITPSQIVHAEAAALHELARRLDGPMRESFAVALHLLARALDGRRPIALTGVGKSGLIAQKIAATLRSTGAPAHFLHPTEALHGDLGMLASSSPTPDATPGVLLALSASGETAELLALLPSVQRLNLQLIALTGCLTSTLARSAAVVLDTSCSEEACPHNLAPTTSTTVMLALGDALALSLGQQRGFAPDDFAELHPAGRLGDRLARVRDRMHTGDDLPIVSPATPMPDVIYEMSRKQLGLTAVCAPDPDPTAPGLPPATPPARHLLGIISDGDLRRMLEREGARSLTLTAADILHPNPRTIAPDALCSAALAEMEQRSITALLVTSPTGDLQGVLHLHDLWKLNLL